MKEARYSLTQEQLNDLAAIAADRAVEAYRSEEQKTQKRKDNENVRITKKKLQSYRRVKASLAETEEFTEDEKLHGTIVLLKDVPADAQVKVTFAADAAVYQRDYAEEVYEILEKAQITYAQKTDVYKVVKELGTEAVPVLVSMNLNPSLLGVLMEILTMGI